MHTFSRERKILGLKATAISGAGLLDRIDIAVLRRQRIIIASLNLHGIYVYFTDSAFRALHQDDQTLVRVDGMSAVMLARLSRTRLHREHRIAWIDLLPHLMAKAASAPWRVFYLGGDPNVLEAGLRNLRAAYPTVALDGLHGFFSATAGGLENERTLARINAWRPDILLVGMGMGRQERWILENRDSLDVPVLAVCGACIEYCAGCAKAPPRWLGAFGAEWAYRLLSDPPRFAWRYLLEPWLALGLLVRANAAALYKASASGGDGRQSQRRPEAVAGARTMQRSTPR
jgi:N-acetylglucosaminyldiphosphoundecaprenol N-acetyl-beta-D-mannosaminyltransferase